MNTQQLKQLEKDLWSAADNLRANTDLKSSEYATPVLGLIFLKFADNNYARAEKKISAQFNKLQGTRREKALSDIAIEHCGFYLPPHARYDYLLNLPEQADIASKIKEAMLAIEHYKVELDGVLPKDEYFLFSRDEQGHGRRALVELVKKFSDIPRDASGDILGKIYEYFLGNFALAEGQGGGQFFTPTSVVRLMVEIIEPYQGTVYDPACGSGGMFVQSQKFVETHRDKLEALGETHHQDQLYVYGQEKTLDTVKLAKMNLAVNGLRGEIKQANSYAEDPYDGLGKFDFVMANPPFNVDDVPIATVEADPRFNTYGIPRKKTKIKKSEQGKETVPNANYLWINLFAASLKDTGRAALVMANSASDARHSEASIRQTLIENNLIYGMLSLPSNMFYTVTLPATLWFFDKAKTDDKLLFIDARNIFTQIDRAHREFNDAQVQNIAIISKLHKGNRQAFSQLIDHYFAQGMAKLLKINQHISTISQQLLSILGSGNDAITEMNKAWQDLPKQQAQYQAYLNTETQTTVDDRNTAQHALLQLFQVFFEQLHHGLKQLDDMVRQHEKDNTGKRAIQRNIKQLKEALAQQHQDVQQAQANFQHIQWLQERFPQAQYEDVTGLCKLASPEEVKEQDYSLNPGRYVGVVIEEDGKTEAEFKVELGRMNDELEGLNDAAKILQEAITTNLKQLVNKV